MKRKISKTLAVTMIASQMQTVAFAQDIDNVQESNAVNEDVSQTSEKQSSEKGNNVNKDIKKIEIKESAKEKTVAGNEKYESKGKLELDINFSMPIKLADANNTNIAVKLKKDGQVVGTVKLGNDVTTGILEGSDIAYNLEALDGKRSNLKEGATELEFYHLTFENLPLGTYSLEVDGEGYVKAAVDNIEIQNVSKRVLLGTSDKTVVLDETNGVKEVYPGVFLVGDINGDSTINKADYDALKAEIKGGNSKTGNKSDLNRDGKVDITDLTYVHKNMDKSINQPIILDTDAIINVDNAKIDVPETVEVTGDIKNILKDNESSVTLAPKDGATLDENNPISLPIDLIGTATYSLDSKVKVEQVVIKAPSENAPGKGNITIPNAGENGQDLVVSFDEKNSTRITEKTRDGQSVDSIVIDLKQQVAVSQITINVTGGRNNKNLTEITKVEFLNNVYKEMPAPKMNIPVINNFTSTTAVGKEAMTLGWDHQPNVTGYEIKVEELNGKGGVKSTSKYKTTENSLRIEKVNGYSTYRVSIQSLSGDDWKSGYKDEQDGYSASEKGDTNLKNNSNDKDGIADNVDTNYNPRAWDSIKGTLASKAEGDNGSNFGADSIIEVQVIPETAPEGPEGIKIESLYKGLKVSWKSHKKARDYDLYYRKVGTGEWIKANDPRDPKYQDSDPNNDIPDGVADLKPEQKNDNDELIRATQYTINGLEDQTAYEIKMTATNHHGTGGLSETYIGSTAKLVPPQITSYKLINTPSNDGSLTNNIEKVELRSNDPIYEGNGEEMFDNNFATAFVRKDWCGGVDYEREMPIVTFNDEYTFDTIRFAAKLENPGLHTLAHKAKLYIYDDAGKVIKTVNPNELTVSHKRDKNGVSYAEVKLKEPVTAKKVSLRMDVYGGKYVSISELKFYHYDSLENDVDALFKDDLMLELNDNVTQEMIDELILRAKTIDNASMEYHPKQDQILADLERAQDLYNDVKLSDNIKTLDVGIRNNTSTDGGHTIGQSNDYQALGVAVRPGDTVNIYIGSSRANTEFKLAITQHNGESGTYITEYSMPLKVGKNEIVIPDSPFDMNYEKGGNLYLKFARNYDDGQKAQVRVSGGTEIPHLNVSDIINDSSKEAEVKGRIETYIKELKSYVSTVKDRYPESATIEDNAKNIYAYDAETSILNSTEIEGRRISLSLAADQVLKGIEDGIVGNTEAQVNRVYDTLLAWEQLMKVSYLQQGLLEEPIDFDGDGKITNTALDKLNGKSEQEFFKDNKAPLNRINVKYQRMFTGAFMYASSHHVGIGYGSIPDMMKGVPFKFDENGKLLNSSEGSLFGWGINHEVGHVHDRPGLTYAETTNNILALITQTFNDMNESRIEGSFYKSAYDKVTSGSEGLASNATARLAMFWQLHLAYDNDYTYEMLSLNSDNSLENDTFYAKLYRATRVNGVAQKEVGHDQTAQTFIMRASDAVQKDLREFFKRWGLVASPKTNQYLDKKAYPKEDKAIFYLNDEARRKRLAAIDSNDMSSITKSEDTRAIGTFGVDKNGNKITDKSYLNQKEVPLNLSVNKDSEKILGYEIIRVEATSTGVKESPVGFVQRDKNSDVTEYVDVVDAINNRAFTYKVRAYDYNLNVTEVSEIGSVKISHDGSIAKSSWVFDTNTRSADDSVNEDSGHGQAQNGAINNIKDNDISTVYNASKATLDNGQVVAGDPYITIDMGTNKSVIGLKYNPGNTGAKKFSLKNFFKKEKETTYSPITNYEVHVSKDGSSWTKAHSGKFDPSKENIIYFNEAGSSDNSQLWAYDAQYVKLVAKGAKTISVAELDILGPQGDNIEIGVDNNDQVYKNGVGRLKSNYEYAEGKFIPEGSIVVTGEYKGDPAFNVPLIINENGGNFALKSQAILLANIPEGSQIGEVAEGNWLYWITPEQQEEIIDGENNIEGKSIKAELYRYNKLDSQNRPVGQRLVSDTFYINLPENLADLPLIDLVGGTGRALNNSYDKIIEVDSNTMKSIMENR